MRIAGRVVWGKNILVVGGAGYLGGAVTDALMGTEFDVRVYDSLIYSDCYLKSVPFVRGDVRDTERLLCELEWADAVVWLAAIVGDGACEVDPEETVKVNKEAVIWLSENFEGRIVFTSTCSVYGASDDLLTEESPTDPLSLYAATKLDAEQFLMDRDAVIFRLGTLFGIADTYSRPRFDLVVNTLTKKGVLEKRLTVFGGDQFRPLLHVRDAGKIIVESIASDERGVFNLHRQNMKIIDLASRIRAKVPDCELEVTPTKYEDVRNYRVSSERALVHFRRPLRDVDYGIDELRGLILSGRIRDPDNVLYSNEAFLKSKKEEHNG